MERGEGLDLEIDVEEEGVEEEEEEEEEEVAGTLPTFTGVPKGRERGNGDLPRLFDSTHGGGKGKSSDLPPTFYGTTGGGRGDEDNYPQVLGVMLVEEERNGTPVGPSRDTGKELVEEASLGDVRGVKRLRREGSGGERLEASPEVTEVMQSYSIHLHRIIEPRLAYESGCVRSLEQEVTGLQMRMNQLWSDNEMLRRDLIDAQMDLFESELTTISSSGARRWFLDLCQ